MVGAGVLMTIVILSAALMAPQRCSGCPTAYPAFSPARPVLPGGRSQLPGAGEDLARYGDSCALLDGVLPGERPTPALLGDWLPTSLWSPVSV